MFSKRVGTRKEHSHPPKKQARTTRPEIILFANIMNFIIMFFREARKKASTVKYSLCLLLEKRSGFPGRDGFQNRRVDFLLSAHYLLRMSTNFQKLSTDTAIQPTKLTYKEKSMPDFNVTPLAVSKLKEYNLIGNLNL